MVILSNDLQVVIGEADAAERCRRQHGDPDVDIRQVGPQQGGHERRGEDQHAAHGRRPRLRAMTLRSFLADHLPDLELTQTSDHPGAEKKTDSERRQARRRRAKRDVPGDVQDTKPGVQREEQEVQHRSTARPAGCAGATELSSPLRHRRRAASGCRWSDISRVPFRQPAPGLRSRPCRWRARSPDDDR